MSKSEKRARVTLTIDITFDPEHTDAESIANALDIALENSLTSGILDDYGNVQCGPFIVPV